MIWLDGAHLADELRHLATLRLPKIPRIAGMTFLRLSAMPMALNAGWVYIKLSISGFGMGSPSRRHLQ